MSKTDWAIVIVGMIFFIGFTSFGMYYLYQAWQPAFWLGIAVITAIGVIGLQMIGVFDRKSKKSKQNEVGN